MGKLQGFTVVIHNLYIKNHPKALTYISNLCFNSQVGEKNYNSIKKGMKANSVGLSHHQMLFCSLGKSVQTM